MPKINTNTIQSSVEEINSRQKYYSKKSSSFLFSTYKVPSGSSIANFLKEIQSNYDNISRNLTALSKYLADFCKDVEALENKMGHSGSGFISVDTVQSIVMKSYNLIQVKEFDYDKLYDDVDMVNYVGTGNTLAKSTALSKYSYTEEEQSAILALAETNAVLTDEQIAFLKDYGKVSYEILLQKENADVAVSRAEKERLEAIGTAMKQKGYRMEDLDLAIKRQRKEALFEATQLANFYLEGNYTARDLNTLGISEAKLKSMSEDNLAELIVEKDTAVGVEYKKLLKMMESSGFSDYESYQEALTKATEVASVAYGIRHKTIQDMKLNPYELEKRSQDYHDFKVTKVVNEKDISQFVHLGDGTNIADYNKYCEENGEVTPYEFMKAVREVYGDQVSYLGIKTSDKELYDNLTVAETVDEEIVRLYEYLYYKKGEKEALKYLKDAEDQINQACGQVAAQDFLDGLSDLDEEGQLSVLANHVKVAGKGFEDGVEGYFRNVGYYFEGLFTGEEDRTYSSAEYESMYILQAFASEEDKLKNDLIIKDEEGNLHSASDVVDFTKNYGKFLNHNYQISQSIGNMAPAMAASVATGHILGAAGVGASTVGTVSQVVSGTTMAIGAAGGSYHNAMVEGYDKDLSLVYGTVSGIAESVSEVTLGGLPFMSETRVFNLTSYLKAMKNEFLEELIQTYIGAGIDTVILGKDFDMKQTTEEAVQSGIYGGITAGVMQGPALAVNSFQISSINEAIRLGRVNETMIVEAMNEYIPETKGMTFEQIMQEYTSATKSQTTRLAYENALNKINQTINTQSQSINTLESLAARKEQLLQQYPDLAKIYNDGLQGQTIRVPQGYGNAFMEFSQIQGQLGRYDSTKIDTSILENILTDESTYQKFLDFNHNQDIFGNFERSTYLTGLLRLMESKIKNHVATGDVLSRYNQIVHQDLTNSSMNGIHVDDVVLTAPQSQGLSLDTLIARRNQLLQSYPNLANIENAGINGQAVHVPKDLQNVFFEFKMLQAQIQNYQNAQVKVQPVSKNQSLDHLVAQRDQLLQENPGLANIYNAMLGDQAVYVPKNLENAFSKLVKLQTQIQNYQNAQGSTNVNTNTQNNISAINESLGKVVSSSLSKVTSALHSLKSSIFDSKNTTSNVNLEIQENVSKILNDSSTCFEYLDGKFGNADFLREHYLPAIENYIREGQKRGTLKDIEIENYRMIQEKNRIATDLKAGYNTAIKAFHNEGYSNSDIALNLISFLRGKDSNSMVIRGLENYFKRFQSTDIREAGFLEISNLLANETNHNLDYYMAKMYTLFATDSNSNNVVTDFFYDSMSNAILNDQSNSVQFILKSIVKLKELNPAFHLELNQSLNCFQFKHDVIMLSSEMININSLSTMSHELGHALSYYLFGNGISSFAQSSGFLDVIAKTQRYFQNSKEASKLVSDMQQVAYQSYNMAIQELLQSKNMTQDAYINALTQKYQQMYPYESSMNCKNMAIQEFNSEVQHIKESINRQYFSFEASVSDIIDALFLGEPPVSLSYHHGSNYYSQFISPNHIALDEIIANYTSIRMSSPELLGRFESIFGSDFSNMLNKIYESFYDSNRIKPILEQGKSQSYFKFKENGQDGGLNESANQTLEIQKNVSKILNDPSTCFEYLEGKFGNADYVREHYLPVIENYIQEGQKRGTLRDIEIENYEIIKEKNRIATNLKVNFVDVINQFQNEGYNNSSIALKLISFLRGKNDNSDITQKLVNFSQNFQNSDVREAGLLEIFNLLNNETVHDLDYQLAKVYLLFANDSNSNSYVTDFFYDSLSNAALNDQSHSFEFILNSVIKLKELNPEFHFELNQSLNCFKGRADAIFIKPSTIENRLNNVIIHEFGHALCAYIFGNDVSSFAESSGYLNVLGKAQEHIQNSKEASIFISDLENISRGISNRAIYETLQSKNMTEQEYFAFLCQKYEQMAPNLDPSVYYNLATQAYNDEIYQAIEKISFQENFFETSVSDIIDAIYLGNPPVPVDYKHGSKYYMKSARPYCLALDEMVANYTSIRMNSPELLGRFESIVGPDLSNVLNKIYETFFDSDRIQPNLNNLKVYYSK